MQKLAMQCKVLQISAKAWNTLLRLAAMFAIICKSLQYTLQHVANVCNMLQWFTIPCKGYTEHWQLLAPVQLCTDTFRLANEVKTGAQILTNCNIVVVCEIQKIVSWHQTWDNLISCLVSDLMSGVWSHVWCVSIYVNNFVNNLID